MAAKKKGKNLGKKKAVKKKNKGKPEIQSSSMSDIAFWKPDWMHMVLQKIRQHPEHIFLFLTKDPKAYEKLDFPENCWLGITITRQAEMDELEDYLTCEADVSWSVKRNVFLSIEPILEPVTPTIMPDWLIIGAETGNRKEKIVPELEWIQNLVFFGIPVFMKGSLQELWQMPLIQQFPEEMMYIGVDPAAPGADRTIHQEIEA